MSTKTPMVVDTSAFAGVFKDMWRQIGDGSLNLSHFKALIEHRNPFAISSIQEEWQEFYRKYFRISVDFSGVAIPVEQGTFTRALFIPKGLTIGQVIKAMKKHFLAWTYREDLDQDVTVNDRSTQESYAISVRDRQEADEELKRLSANDLQKYEIKTMTLLERLVYELKYYSETGEHLDVVNITICAGSRDLRGNVPGVRWVADSRKLRVNWFNADRVYDSLRARAAVSS